MKHETKYILMFDYKQTLLNSISGEIKTYNLKYKNEFETLELATNKLKEYKNKKSVKKISNIKMYKKIIEYTLISNK